MRNVLLAAAALFVAPAVHADEPPAPLWIWQEDQTSGEALVFTRQFELKEVPKRATLTLATDFCSAFLFGIDNRRKPYKRPYGQPADFDVTDQLRSGENKIVFMCDAIAGPSAVWARLEIEDSSGKQFIVTDSQWTVGPFGEMATEVTTYGQVEKYRFGLDQTPITISPVDDYTQWKRAINSGQGTDPRTFDVAPGFEVDLIHSARKGEDSWVSLTVDPKGRWIIGQEKQGLLRLSIDAADAPVNVERIDMALRECRGVQFKDGALYALANNDKALYRLRDTTSDDQFDSVEKLFTFEGDVGHGRNQLTLSPDGTLYGIFGDAVVEPESLSSLVPALAKPTDIDKTRNGFVVRFDTEGISQSTVITRGLRNPYGIAFNAHGDMFTYDADAEYDMGSSWYRPTRVLHLIPGGDYRWRRVTKQWPPYFPDQADMPQPTLDIGKGSPTAVAFGSGEQFPKKYADALYILDWAYGRIVAVHLTPRGSSYLAAPETFLRGQPLNVTDIEFGPDGAMYFITGGRQTQSALYRVRYVGTKPEPKPPSRQRLAREAHAKESRRIRNQLHRWAASPDPANLDTIWKHLGSQDPWIRHAARTALEHVPVNAWQKKVAEETNITVQMAAYMALIRVAEQPPWSEIADKVLFTDHRQVDHYYDEECFWIWGKIFEHREALTGEDRRRLRNWLAPTISGVARFDLQNLSLGARLDYERFVPAAMKQLTTLSGSSPEQRFHYLFVLRNQTTGWTEELRETYFRELKQLDEVIGGQGMPDFRRLIRQEALASVPESERPKYEAMLKADQPAWLAEIPSEPREFVRKWQPADFIDDTAFNSNKRDTANGKMVFAAASCIRCHRFQGRGDVSGPDLTDVSRRFAPRDLLLSILHPSKVVSEKYASSTIELSDGRVVSGTIAPGDYRSPDLVIVPNLLEPEQTVTVRKADIVNRGVSSVSPMPEGLLDTFEKDEILDLLSFLQGQPE